VTSGSWSPLFKGFLVRSIGAVRYVGLALTVTLAACGPTVPSFENTTGPETSSTTLQAEGSQASTTTGGPHPPTTATRVPQADSAAIPEWFADQTDLPAALSIAIKEQLAANGETSIDKITESGAMFVTWRDSGLGCSGAGEINLQVLTDGYLAYFDVAGVTYRVHTDTGSAFRICDSSSPPNPLDQM
jgi:hypothetical protein